METIKELVNQEWYIGLVEECKAIITEAVFTSRWALVEGYWKLGERIREEKGLKKWAQGEAGEVLQGLAKDLSISTRTLHYALQAYEKFPDLGSIPEGKNITWNKLITQYLPEQKKSEVELPKEKFNVIYADPPWQFDNSGFEQSAASIYPTMSTDEICAMPVKEVAQGEAVMFMWATNAMLEDALRVVTAWGFDYKTNIVWIKDRAPGMGWFTQSKHELLLIAVKGNGLHPEFKPDSWLKASVTKHSKKPHEFYDIIEKMYPKQKYIELFARNERSNWTSWGNQV